MCYYRSPPLCLMTIFTGLRFSFDFVFIVTVIIVVKVPPVLYVFYTDSRIGNLWSWKCHTMAGTRTDPVRLRRYRQLPLRRLTSDTACSTPAAARGAAATERNTRYISSKSSTIKAIRCSSIQASITERTHRAREVAPDLTHS